MATAPAFGSREYNLQRWQDPDYRNKTLNSRKRPHPALWWVSRVGHGFRELTGVRFNRLLAVYPQRRSNRIYWYCLCDCGNEVWVLADHLQYRHAQSCGCLNSEVSAHRARRNLALLRVGLAKFRANLTQEQRFLISAPVRRPEVQLRSRIAKFLLSYSEPVKLADASPELIEEAKIILSQQDKIKELTCELASQIKAARPEKEKHNGQLQCDVSPTQTPPQNPTGF